MSLSLTETEEIRLLIHEELAAIETDFCEHAGSFNYLCSIGGVGSVFTHHPVGRVIRQFH